MGAVIAWVLGQLKAVIAFVMTYRVDEKRRRTELYDRRITVFDAIERYTWNVASGNIQPQMEQEFLDSTKHVSFLFGKDIRWFVDEVFQRSRRLHALSVEEGHLSGKALEENLQKQDALRDWFVNEAKGLDRRFGRYLTL